MFTNGINGAIAAVVLAASMSAHAAPAAVFALNAPATMLTNAATTAVFAKPLQTPMLADILSGAAAAFHVASLISTAAANVVLVRAGETGKAAEHSGRADQRADGGIFLYSIVVLRIRRPFVDGAKRDNVDKVAKKRNVRIFPDCLNCRHCQRREQTAAEKGEYADNYLQS